MVLLVVDSSSILRLKNGDHRNNRNDWILELCGSVLTPTPNSFFTKSGSSEEMEAMKAINLEILGEFLLLFFYKWISIS